MPAENVAQATHEKQVKRAAWIYQTPEGNQRIAGFNDVVTIADDELQRGEQMGVFTEIPPSPYPPPGMPFMVTSTSGLRPQSS